jgi:hypothetical protein
MTIGAIAGFVIESKWEDADGWFVAAGFMLAIFAVIHIVGHWLYPLYMFGSPR